MEGREHRSGGRCWRHAPYGARALKKNVSHAWLFAVSRML